MIRFSEPDPVGSNDYNTPRLAIQRVSSTCGYLGQSSHKGIESGSFEPNTGQSSVKPEGDVCAIADIAIWLDERSVLAERGRSYLPVLPQL